MTTEDGGVEPDWQRTALEYAKRIQVLERIAVADQQSYRKLHEELELCRVCLSDAEGMYSLKCNDLRELRAKVEQAAAELKHHALPLLSGNGAAEYAVLKALEALR